jgi:hypothetical protein
LDLKVARVFTCIQRGMWHCSWRRKRWVVEYGSGLKL